MLNGVAELPILPLLAAPPLRIFPVITRFPNTLCVELALAPVPIFKLPVIPTPPCTCNAPVEVDVDTVPYLTDKLPLGSGLPIKYPLITLPKITLPPLKFMPNEYGVA